MKRSAPSIFTFLLVLLFSMTTQHGLAQTNLLFYHSDGYYNAPDYNPAFLTNQKNFTFNIFPMAGGGFNYNNKEAVDKLRKILFNEEIDDKTKETFRSLVKKDLSYNQADMNLLNVGINTSVGAFNFQLKEKVYVLMRFGGDFSRFLMDTLGTETVGLNQAQEFPTEDVHFREYSLGYANQLIKDKLSVGLRAKLYYGKSFTTSSVTGYITEDEGNYYVQSQGDIFFSVPATDNEQNGEISEIDIMEGKTAGDYLFNNSNSGFGLDLGLNWKINPQLEFSASVLDLGSIKWDKYLYRLNFDEGTYQVENIYLDPETNTLVKESDEIDLIDNISSLYTIEPTNAASYTTGMPTSFLAGLKYRYDKYLTLGILNRYIQEENMGHNSLQVSVNYTVNEQLSLVSGLGIYHNSFKNLPLGLIYRWNRAQFWAGTDNLLSFFVPKFSDYTSLTLGVDFNLFGPKVKYEKVKYLPFFKLKKTRRKKSDGLIFSSASN